MSLTYLNFWRLPTFLKVATFIILSYLSPFPHAARGETTNKRQILPGSRAQALGGAFTAIADDASAGWYNPAGLGFIQGPGVSVSVNNYSKSRKTVSGLSEGSTLNENSSSLYPGFAGGHVSAGIFSFGWSYFTNEQQNTDESQTIAVVADDGDSFKYQRSELSSGDLIHAGTTVAMKFGSYLSLGISEFYYRREKQTTLKERSTYVSGVFYDTYVRQSTQNEGTVGVAGILLRASSYSLGLSARIPRALSDKTSVDVSTITYTSNAPELSTATMQTHREDELIVRTWNLGLAWNPSKEFLLTMDAIYYPPTRSPWLNAGGFNTKSVVDLSAGLEVLWDQVVLDAGIFKNSSLVDSPRPSLTHEDPGRIDFVGFSAGLGLRTKQSEMMIVFVRQKGQGESQMVQGSLSLQKTTRETDTFSIANRYQF